MSKRSVRRLLADRAETNALCPGLMAQNLEYQMGLNRYQQGDLGPSLVHLL